MYKFIYINNIINIYIYIYISISLESLSGASRGELRALAPSNASTASPERWDGRFFRACPARSEICKKVAAQQFLWHLAFKIGDGSRHELIRPETLCRNPTVYLPSFYAFNGLLR